MAVMLNAFSACLVLLLIMGVGYFMGHKGWMGNLEKKFLTKYITCIAVPCMCIRGLTTNMDRAGMAEAAVMMLSVFLGLTVNLVLAYVLMHLLKLPRPQRGVFLTMCSYSNSMFIGLPICTQLFGDGCVPQVMTYYLVNTSLFQMLGVSLIAHYGEGGGQKSGILGMAKDFFGKPPVVSIFIAIAMVLLDIPLPETISRFMNYLSNSLTPMALIYCGFVVYELGLGNVRLMKGIPSMLVVRLMVAPAICLLFCHLFHIEGLARGVFTIQASLPIVSQTPVMAGAYGADDRYAAVGATLSTLGCIVTIPILMLILS